MLPKEMRKANGHGTEVCAMDDSIAGKSKGSSWVENVASASTQRSFGEEGEGHHPKVG